eukprot:GHVR01141284.1.p1 GENE.GHVR01141284.1~~GHVR01141284.1.p1  ORF type:complete len:151 (+),score=13.65 GHVR01141284.1:111-563(+)
MPPLLDDQVLKMLVSNGYTKEDYGRQKCFSAISYIFVTFYGAIWLFPEWNYINAKKIIWPLFIFATVYSLFIYFFVPNSKEQNEIRKREEKQTEENTEDINNNINRKNILLNVGFLCFLSIWNNLWSNVILPRNISHNNNRIQFNRNSHW